MTLRIGVVGMTHDHIWGNLKELSEIDGGELVAAADHSAELRDKVAAEYSCAVYGCYQEMIKNEELDAVYVFADNKGGAEQATWALNQGLHVMIEKPMAATLAGAQAMAAAEKSSGKRLMINWPTAWWPQLQHGMKLAKDGTIGDLWQVRYRAAHSGPRNEGCSEHFCGWLYDKELNGAGAFMDYCCYGSILARVMIGKTEDVTGIASQVDPSLEVEDNGILVCKYPNAMAVAEASWSQIGKVTAYTTVFYGSKGLLLMDHFADDALIMADKENGAGTGVAVPELPAHMQSASAHFTHCIASGEDFQDLCRSDLNLESQVMLCAGMESAGI
ncbi:MAG: Gfo/Idh/MocA family oxidoreductase [Planctomycetes bacterium]|nr:Gfo/Idh/MocA family oxidoreductase [Planctomycetota bacterium]